MSFLKTDGLVFEDEEELDDELEDEETDVGTETDGETPDEESPEDEDNGEDDDEESELLKKIQERKDANRLKKILKTAPYRFYPHVTNSEKNLINKLKKKPQHKLEILRFEQLMMQRKEAFKAKVKSVITPALPFIGMFALIVFIIIAVIVIIGTLMPWLFPDDETGGGNKGAASPFGMKGDKFYGGRVVYRDDVLAQNGLIEQYVDVFESAVENLQTTTFTETVGGTEYEVKLTINLTLPADDFNYEELDLTTFATENTVLYNMVVDMAKLSYKVDNGIENDADIPTELTDILNGVKYFGFNEDMIGESIVDEDDNVDNNIIEIVYDALKTNILIQEKEKGTASEFQEATNVTIENIDDNIREKVVASINVAENKIRTEKLFIKDIILDGDDKYMEGIEKKSYVALIYLPKQDVKFDYVSYMITIDKDVEFSAILSNNGSEITLTKGEGENWSTDEEETEPKELTYTFKSAENLNQTASVSDVVNTANLNNFSSPSSLFKIVTNSSDYTTYLHEQTLENGDVVLTYKTGNMFILFETDAEFIISEEIKY